MKKINHNVYNTTPHDIYNNYFGPVIFFAGIVSFFLLIINIDYLKINNLNAKISSTDFLFLFSILFILLFFFRRSIPGKAKELILVLTCLYLSITFSIFILALHSKILHPAKYWLNLMMMTFIFLIITVGSIIKIRQNNIQSSKINSLTGFGNTKWISEHVNKRIQNGVESGILLLIDVKNFRIINSIYGREYGNSLITMFSDFFRPFMNNKFNIAHLGGIEFCLWIEEVNKEKIPTQIESMKQIFKKNISEDEKNVNLFIHTAGVIYPEHGTDFNQLFSRANMAMEKTQVNEQQSDIFYSSEIETNLKSENILSYEILKSLENGDFHIHYQEKYNMDGTKVLGLEALARCNSSVLGIVSPNIFIPIIHKLNLTNSFTDMIIELVFKEINAIDNFYGQDVQVSINIPPSYFQYYNFIDFIENLVAETGINPERLTFEITEDLFIDGYEAVTRIIEKLQDMGIKISLDDFGTGYSAFSYIQNLPIQELKIDKSFIDHICDDKKSFILVKAICDIAHVNNYLVVAEGVEHEDQIQLLKQTSCDIIQGFIYSKPASLIDKQILRN